MRLTAAVDSYIEDAQREGRINSPHTERAYRHKLECLAELAGNRDPRNIGREDIKQTLRLWPNPNSQRQAHAVLTAFFDWCMEEGIRKDNPARQVRRARAKVPEVYRLTRSEVLQLFGATEGPRYRRDRWVVRLGCVAGLRSQEMLGLRGEHLQRDGWVHVGPDIAKGAKERWVPVLPDLAEAVGEMRALVALDAYVLPSRRIATPPYNTTFVEVPDAQLSHSALWKQVWKLGQRAGIKAHITPHTLRHAFGDHVARFAGLRVAQALMGHVNVETTATTYVGKATLDELAESVAGFSYRRQIEGS